MPETIDRKNNRPLNTIRLFTDWIYLLLSILIPAVSPEDGALCTSAESYGSGSDHAADPDPNLAKQSNATKRKLH